MYWRCYENFTQYEPSLPKPTMADTIFVLTREDVIECAREMGIPKEAITDDILAQVKKGMEWGTGVLV